MTTLRVHLADAPTDVLVWLAERPANLWWTAEEIAAATAPPDADDALASVASALTLLRSMGYVVQNRETGGWAATGDGWRAVESATPHHQAEEPVITRPTQVARETPLQRDADGFAIIPTVSFPCRSWRRIPGRVWKCEKSAEHAGEHQATFNDVKVSWPT